MKSERRHELEHNQLAQWLSKTAVALQPYQNIILVAVLAVLVAVVGYTWLSKQSRAEATKAWDELNAALESGNVEELLKVIESHPNTIVADTASVVLADFYCAGACNRLFSNKATAQEELNKAMRHYKAVLKHSQLPSLLDRATFGLARANEAKGELEEAERLYGEVATNWPNGAYAAEAKQRQADLKRPATKAMYDRFAKFDPKPAFSREPGQTPAFDMNNLSEEGMDYSFGADEKKPAEESKPVETKPADAAPPPADAKPADAAAPAEQKPGNSENAK